MFSRASWYQEDLEYISNYRIDWDRLSKKTILVTGATGLIGTVLVDALMFRNSQSNSNIKVIALSRNEDGLKRRFADYDSDDNFTFFACDITEKILIEEEKIDYIINLAANTHPDLYSSRPINTISVIVDGVRNVYNLAADKSCQRVINVSSVEVYGENRGDVERFSESYSGIIDSNTLRAGYPESKRLSESISQAYISEKGLDIISARIGRVYGSTIQESDTKSTSQFIRNAVDGDDVILRSNGQQQYSYIYVADVVTAFLTLIVSGISGEAYNISNDEIKSFYETAEILSQMNGKAVKFEIAQTQDSPGSSTVKKALMDSSKMNRLGWECKYNLVEGLNRTVRILRSVS